MTAVNCPRCGRAQPPGSDGAVFCAHCGQFLVATAWVAQPPPPPGGAPPVRPRRRAYAGPPRYLSPPRWGFPAAPWKRPDAEPAAAPARIPDHAGLLVPLLRGLAALALLSAAGEIWRYLLLLRSRGGALDAREVAASDALVEAASWMCLVMVVVVGVWLLAWVLRMIEVVAERAGARPSRGRLAVIAGWVVPVVNLSVPGSVLAEIEHGALDRPASRRPSPSRLLLVWWALWAANVLLGLLTALWSLRTGVQARADGVTLHALVDLLAAATALVTARVVLWLTALVAPPRVVPRPRVVSVRGPGTGAAAGVGSGASTVSGR